MAKRRVARPGGKPQTWTIMLYLSGDNNLSEDMVRALVDIKNEGVPPGTKFTIQYDPASPGFPTYRYAIAGGGKGSSKGALEQKALENEREGPLPIPEYLEDRLQDENSADFRVLASFIRWSVRTCKSTHRMLILSGHGSGAVGDFLEDDNAIAGQPRSFTIPELAKALRLAEEGDTQDEGVAPDDKGALGGRLEDEILTSGGEPRLIHILGMDSCLMGMAEVGHEVRGQVEYLVGSEGFFPNAGWPYAHLLRQLKERAGEGMDSKSVANRLVEDIIGYYKQYIPAGTSLDMAACRLKGLDGVVKAVHALTKALRLRAESESGLQDEDRTIRDLVVASHWRAQSYKYEQYSDLWDFCDRLEEAAVRLSQQLGGGRAKGSPAGRMRDRLRLLPTRCRGVKAAIKAMAVSDHAGPDFQHSHGLGVFFPWSMATVGGIGALEHYRKLAFPQQSCWSDLLTAYLVCSQREPRKEDGPLLGGTQRMSVAPPPGSGRHAEGSSKHAEGSSKHAEGASKFAALIARLAPEGVLPWSMKNPPLGVRWPSRRPRTTAAARNAVSPPSPKQPHAGKK